MNTLPFTLLLFLTAGLCACTISLPLNYAPSNLTRGSGGLQVQRFAYPPAEKGEVAPNEMQKKHPSIGTRLLQRDVGDFVADALRKELSLSGYTLSSDSSRVVSGSVDRFYIDWVGFSTIDVEVALTFSVHSGSSSLFTATYKSHQQAPKSDLGITAETIKLALAECFHQFIREAHARGAFQ